MPTPHDNILTRSSFLPSGAEMKIRSAFFLVVTTAILLASCRPAPGGNVPFMVFGDPAELAADQKLVDSFSQSHPDFQVEVIQVPGQSDYRKRLAADLVAGTPADVVFINYRRHAEFANTGALEPLGPYLEKSSLIKEEDFYQEAVKPYILKGELMCIPQNISSSCSVLQQGYVRCDGHPLPSR